MFFIYLYKMFDKNVGLFFEGVHKLLLQLFQIEFFLIQLLTQMQPQNFKLNV